MTGISPGFLGINFAQMTNPETKAAIQKRVDEIALEPDAIARSMAFAIERPDHVDVGDIVVRPAVPGLKGTRIPNCAKYRRLRSNPTTGLARRNIAPKRPAKETPPDGWVSSGGLS